MGIRRIKIKHRPLRVWWGFAFPTKNRIEISTNLTDAQYLDTLIHEILHILYPDTAETTIADQASTIRYYLWRAGYRSGRPLRRPRKAK
jgi:hypothetical protein